MSDYEAVGGLRRIYEDKYNTMPDAPACFYRVRKNVFTVTYREIYEKIAVCRARYSTTAPNRCGILGMNSIGWIYHAVGLISSGRTTALLDPLLPEDDLICAIRRSDLQYILCDNDCSELADCIHRELPNVEIAFYGNDSDGVPSDADIDTLNHFFPWEDGDILFYTSGTTKNSKIVVTSTYSVVGNLLCQRPQIRAYPGERMLTPLPLHHSWGFVSFHLFYSLGTPVCISSMRYLQKDIGVFHPKIIAAVPSAAEFLLDKKLIYPELEMIILAGGYCSKELATRIRACGPIVQNNYGSSEIPGGPGVNLPDDEVDCTTIHPRAHVEISSEGEIIITTPFHFTCYYCNPEETAEVLDESGRIHTGDLGFLDDLGRLHVLGRRKNMLVMKNGEKVLCEDVDRSLSTLPGVKEGAVIYAHDMLIACLVPHSGVIQEMLEKALEDYNRTQPVYRRIRRFVCYESFPYTASGKLKRRLLEEDYLKRNP